MTRILVTHPYHLALDPRELALMRPYPPLSVLVAAGQLERAGHDVTFHDRTFEPGPASFAQACRGFERVAILGDDHAVPMKMCLRSISEAHRAMARMARGHGVQVLVAGPDVSDHPEEYVAERTSAAVGDSSELVVEWTRGDGDIEGLHGPQGSGGRRANPQDLDGLADAAWHLASLGPYRDAWRARHGHWELNLYTSRGCPFRCNWCAKPTWGRTHLVRSPERVAAEIERVRALWAPDRFAMTDDIFALRPAWLEAFRRALTGPVAFRCLSRADLLAVPHFAAALRAAGADEVWLGAESGADHVLEAMDKDCTTAEIATAVQEAKAAGLRVGLFLQLGYPGERHQDVLATVRLVEELAPDEIGVSVSYPLPGTAFHARVAATLRARNWDASMENRPLFETPHSHAYYQWARALLRSTRSGSQWARGLEGFLRQPDRRTARRLAGSAYHRARTPFLRAGLRLHASPEAS